MTEWVSALLVCSCGVVVVVWGVGVHCSEMNIVFCRSIFLFIDLFRGCCFSCLSDLFGWPVCENENGLLYLFVQISCYVYGMCMICFELVLGSWGEGCVWI